MNIKILLQQKFCAIAYFPTKSSSFVNYRIETIIGNIAYRIVNFIIVFLQLHYLNTFLYCREILYKYNEVIINAITGHTIVFVGI